MTDEITDIDKMRNSPLVKRIPKKLVIVDTDMPRGVLADTWFPAGVAVAVSPAGFHLLIDVQDYLEEGNRPPLERTIPKEHLVRVQSDLTWSRGAAMDLCVQDVTGVRRGFRIRFGSDESYWVEALAKLLSDEYGLAVAPF